MAQISTVLNKIKLYTEERYLADVESGNAPNETIYAIPVEGVAGGIDIGDADIIFMSYKPSDEEAEQLGIQPNTAIIVYDPTMARKRFGADAREITNLALGTSYTEEEFAEMQRGETTLEAAAQAGYAGTQGELNDTLANVGNINNVMDRLLGLNV